jgi:hypothetical protein
MNTTSNSIKQSTRFAVALSLLASLVASAPKSSNASAGVDCVLPAQVGPVTARPRYGAPEKLFGFDDVLVHYVTEGPDAPDVGGLDTDGVPLYVKLAAAAGDFVIAYYQEQHPREDLPPMPAFPVVPCDRGGGDSRIDIYLKSGTGGFGVAYPPASAEGGNFVVLDTHLPLTQLGDPFFDRNGVIFTVFHEFFHLVQYAYVPVRMPSWIAEGTANAMALDAEAQITRTAHPILYSQLDSWRRTPSQPHYAEGTNCERCYGGISWWYVFAPHIPKYFNALRAEYTRGRALGLGLSQLRQVFADNCQTIIRGCPANFPLALDVGLLTYGLVQYIDGSTIPELTPMRPLFSLRIGRTASFTRTIQPMSLHFVRLVIPNGVHKIDFRVSGRPNHPEMAVALGIVGKNARIVYGANRTAPIPRRYSLPRMLSTRVTNSERSNSILVISNARTTAIKYQLKYVVH